MKFSEKWLREWVNPPVDTAELADQLTFLGLEVDSVEPAQPGFENVVVARIESIAPHPDADRLRVCQVDNGTADLVQVVCGAPNARAGLVTALANVGASLPGGMQVKKAKLRGVASHGMLSSAAELGLSEQNEGIMELPEDAPVGTSLARYLELDDNILEVELTPNRGDCLSVRGIARDLCARNDLPLQLHEITELPVAHDTVHPVRVAPNCACVRFASRVITGVDLAAETPVWMVERLRRGGVRSINPAVDVTNYVMLELGQPMHAFDLDKLQGEIQVRLAGEGEALTLLDGREVSLASDTTVIADDTGAISMAGIMGGKGTGCDADTTRIFLECALFLPEEIIGKSRRYACHTDSAHRYERGVDPALQRDAIEYATGLLLNIAGGAPGPIRDWQDKARLPVGEPQVLRASRLSRILGIELPADTVERILTRLGVVNEPVEEGWAVQPPSYRYDLRIEDDFVEEVARVYGYERLPRTLPANTPRFTPVDETVVPVARLRDTLVQRGYQEVVTYSFVNAAQQAALRGDLAPLPLSNPLSSDLAVMRTTLVGGLLDVLRHNSSRQQGDMRLFETGLRFLTRTPGSTANQLDPYIDASLGDDIQIDDELVQQTMLAGLVAGRALPEHWDTGTMAREVDFFDVKADIETLAGIANAEPLRLQPSAHPMLHPGQQASLLRRDVAVGYVGRLNPALQQALDLASAPIVFEIALSALQRAALPQIGPVSRFPAVRRDIALLLDDAVSHQAVVDCVRRHAPATLQQLLTFDLYRGERLEKGKKSMALGLIMQDFSRTLEESEVESAVAAIVAAAGQELGAVLRV